MLIGKEYTMAKYNTVPTMYPCTTCYTYCTRSCREAGPATQTSMMGLLLVIEGLVHLHA